MPLMASLVVSYGVDLGRLLSGWDEHAEAAAATSFSVSRTQDKVSERSVLGQKTRRSAVKGATLAFITAGYSGKRFIFEKAKELGVRSIVLDGPDSWVQLLETEGVIEKFVPIDFSNADTVFDRWVVKHQRSAY